MGMAEIRMGSISAQAEPQSVHEQGDSLIEGVAQMVGLVQAHPRMSIFAGLVGVGIISGVASEISRGRRQRESGDADLHL